MATEEQRAAAFRRAAAARDASVRSRERRLMGSPSARQRLRTNVELPFTLPQPVAAESPDSDRVN